MSDGPGGGTRGSGGTTDNKIRLPTWYWRLWWWCGYHGLYQINWWWKRHRERHHLKDLARTEAYWAQMTDEHARQISFALFLELGAVEAGRFDDEWARRKGTRR